MADSEVSIHVQHPSRRLDPTLCRRVLAHVADREDARIESLSVVLADHETVHALNRRYLDHDFVTDVLAFPFSDSPGVVDGEIYVDLDTAAERHAEFGSGYIHEALRYAVHGLLHLIGYDDRSPEQKAAMHALEDRYLREADIPAGE